MMQTDLSVMITGESGTGKELVARALHEYGRRRNGPFVAINMAAIRATSSNPILFGHEKGAFTGAQNRSTGASSRPRAARSSSTKSATCRWRRRPGSCASPAGRIHHGRRPHAHQDRVRIVAATNKDLRTLINQGLFREDLFYRINVVPLRLPPLRRARGGHPDLVRHFFKQGESEGLQVKRISSGGIELMKRYPMAGNVRELENLIRRLAALYAQDEISAEIIESE